MSCTGLRSCIRVQMSHKATQAEIGTHYTVFLMKIVNYSSKGHILIIIKYRFFAELI